MFDRIKPTTNWSYEMPVLHSHIGKDDDFYTKTKSAHSLENFIKHSHSWNLNRNYTAFQEEVNSYGLIGLKR